MSKVSESRVVRFEGAKNVRDLGGLPAAMGAVTRRGVVYRADGLSRLTEADLAVLAGLSLRTIIDLRYDEEREKSPDRLPLDADIRIVHRGFFPAGSAELFEGVNERGADGRGAFELMRSNYARIPYEHAPEFRDVMHHLIATDSAPHLIHCTSGKDRTGILIAIVLLAVGVPVEDVVADYVLSQGDWQPVDVFGPAARQDAIEMVMAAPAEYILASIESIDRRSGSFGAYLEQELEFGESAQVALRALLLE